jgi:hypothetical protein
MLLTLDGFGEGRSGDRLFESGDTDLNLSLLGIESGAIAGSVG